MKQRIHKVCAVLLFSFFVFLLPACAAEASAEEISMYIEERQYTFVPSPVIREGRMLVPMRGFFEVLGAEVEWCGEQRVASAYREDVEVNIPVGSTAPEMNGAELSIEVAAEIINERTFVPLRFAAECLGYEVSWHEEKQAVIVNEGDGKTNAWEKYIKEAEEKEAGEKGSDESWKVVSTQRGEASWYGSKFHGRGTASGEIFDMYAYTAAHRTLPFNTRVRVTFLQTGREVVVRINDRGPHVAGRIIDLSWAAAEAIGLRACGVGQVKLEGLEKNP